MKKNHRILSRAAVTCLLPMLVLACGQQKGANHGANASHVQKQIDSVENLRSAAQARLDSCITRANTAMDAHAIYADIMDSEYQRFVDSKYMMSKYFSPAEMDMIRDTADNWLPDSARNTDAYKRIAIERGTLLDMQSLFADFVAGGDIDACRKELMCMLVFQDKQGGGYDVYFYDQNINMQLQRQIADYMKISAYRNSRRYLTDEVRGLANSAAESRADVARYDAQLKDLRARLRLPQRRR